MNPDLPQLLAARLKRPLPGPMVGSRFEPQPRHGRHYDRPPPEAKSAAVLMLLYPKRGESAESGDEEWHLPLMVRPGGAEPHAGQVSLPGGAVEQGESSLDAAVREFREEVCPAGHNLMPLGHLTPVYVHVSNYLIAPWLAVARSAPALVANPSEVQEVLEVPLAHLLDPANFGAHERTKEGRPYTAPHFLFRGHRIWGATCMILGELVTILEDLPGGA